LIEQFFICLFTFLEYFSHGWGGHSFTNSG
jgi:hypothetical protein